MLSWLSSLRDGRASVFIDRRIRRLMSGNFGDCKSLNHGLYELRIDYGPGYRLYYCKEGTSGRRRQILNAPVSIKKIMNGEYSETLCIL